MVFRILRFVSLFALALSTFAHAAGPAPAGAGTRLRDAVDEARRVELPGHIHPALRASADLGPADETLRAERLTLILRASDAQESALTRLIDNQQTPGHADFHRWLTPQEFGRRFGVAQQDLDKLKAWLKSRGFTIEGVPAGGRSLEISGSIGQLNRAFATDIRRLDWHGEPHLANARNPTLPAALAPVVRGFASLHDFRSRPLHVRALASATVAPAYGSGASSAIAPGDFAAIYDLNAPYAQSVNGSGRSIAVLGRTSVVNADLALFRSSFGLPANPPSIVNNGAAPARVAGDEMESDLDLEWTGAVAPSAAIKFITSATGVLGDGIDLSIQYAVSNNVADIISLSYGTCETSADTTGGSPFYNQMWQQAAAQGISVFVSSGDSGAAGCDPASAATAVGGLGINQLCSSPYSTCVGGTEFSGDVAAPATYWSPGTSATGTSALGYIPESAWNQSATVTGGSALWSTGGGASMYYAKPSWQYSSGVPADGRRDVPDLALAASSAHDPVLIYSSDGYASSTLLGIGGTSAAAPAMAGFTALVAQKQAGRLGNVNPVLYYLSSQQAKGGAAVFHRVTSGDNSVPGQPGYAASPANPEYSQASGLGSIDGAQLLAAWSAASASVVPTSLTPGTLSVPASSFVGAAGLNLPALTPWSASVPASASAWLSVTPTGGTGPANLSVLIAANTASVARSSTVTVNGQVLAVTQAAALPAGNGSIASISTASLGFPAQAVGSASASQRLLFSNSGSASLTLGSITYSGSNAADFAASGTCSGGAILPKLSSCYFDVSFHPSALGARTASLQIASNAPGSPAVVALSGTGSAAASGAASADVPLPPWALFLTGVALLRALRERPRASFRNP